MESFLTNIVLVTVVVIPYLNHIAVRLAAEMINNKLTPILQEQATNTWHILVTLISMSHNCKHCKSTSMISYSAILSISAFFVHLPKLAVVRDSAILGMCLPLIPQGVALKDIKVHETWRRMRKCSTKWNGEIYEQ